MQALEGGGAARGRGHGGTRCDEGEGAGGDGSRCCGLEGLDGRAIGRYLVVEDSIELRAMLVWRFGELCWRVR